MNRRFGSLWGVRYSPAGKSGIKEQWARLAGSEANDAQPVWARSELQQDNTSQLAGI